MKSSVVPQNTFRSQKCKNWRSQTTFGSWDVEKVHAVVARSAFPSQNVQTTPGSEHFWKLRCRKSVRCCGAKHISKSRCTKHTRFGALLDVQMSFHVAGARDCAPCQEWAKRAGFLVFSKTMAGVGHLKRIWKDAFSLATAIQETCPSEMLGGPGAHFLRWGAFWSIRSSVLGKWFCVTGAALCMTWHHFSWQAQYIRDMDWKNCKTHWYEAVSSALNLPLLKEVSQNCFVFDVANFKHWGSLAEFLRFWCCQLRKLTKSLELLRFWRCQVQKLRKFRRIASFFMLSPSKMKEVSQNSFVFKLADRQKDR